MRNKWHLVVVFLTSIMLLLAACNSKDEIVFVSTRDGNYEIYVMDADGSNRRRLTNNPAYDGSPVWSPDGKQIAFVSIRDGNDEIFVMNADGTGVKNLTNSPEADEMPAWSPDGKRIAFVRDFTGPGGSGYVALYAMNADGSEQGPIRNDQGQFRYFRPNWSPDGSRIVVAYGPSPEQHTDIYVMNAADGSGWTALTTGPQENAHPSWSPDGKKILFVSVTNDVLSSEICVMNPDGSGRAKLTNDSYIDVQPAWSSDGKKVVFVSRRNGFSQIYVMDVDGSNMVRLTDGSLDLMPHWKP